MRRENRFFWQIFIILLIFGIFILASRLQDNLKEVIYFILFPLQEKIWHISQKITHFFFTISSIDKLKKENEILRAENQALQFQLLRLLDLKEENERLRESLNLGLEKEFKLVLVKVAGKDVFENTLLINKGLNHGISEGLPVITSQKILVGKISKVYKNFSKVDLISKEGFSFDVRVGSERILAKATGKGNLKLKISFLPPDFELDEEKIIFSSSLGGIFPDNLLIAKIKEIKKLPLENFKEGEAELLFTKENLDYLFVITQW